MKLPNNAAIAALVITLGFIYEPTQLDSIVVVKELFMPQTNPNQPAPEKCCPRCGSPDKARRLHQLNYLERLKHLSFSLTGNDNALFADKVDVEELLRGYRENVLEDAAASQAENATEALGEEYAGQHHGTTGNSSDSVHSAEASIGASSMSAEHRPQLDRQAKASIIKRIQLWEPEDWDSASKWERHAMNAVSDLVAAEGENAELKAKIAELEHERDEAQRQSQFGWAKVKENELAAIIELRKYLNQAEGETVIGGIRNFAQAMIGREEEIEQLNAELKKAERERDQAREALRWVPVSERLPDNAREVNVLIVSNPTLGSGEKVEVTIVMLGHYRSSGWIDDDGEELGAVKAWADYPTKAAVPPSEEAPATPSFENTVSKDTPILRLIRSAEIDEDLEALSNAALADLLLNRVWAKIDILGTESAIISAAIERLRGAEPAAQPAGKEAPKEMRELLQIFAQSKKIWIENKLASGPVSPADDLGYWNDAVARAESLLKKEGLEP